MRVFRIIILLISMLLALGCQKNRDDRKEIPIATLQLITAYPSQLSDNVEFGSVVITLTFEDNIKIIYPLQVTLNGKEITNVSANLKDLKLVVELEPNTAYNLRIGKGQLEGRLSGSISDEINLSFKTKDLLISTPVVEHPSNELQNLYNFMLACFGKKLITGTMANVSWNINEAEWIKKHTGKYPALNCFDYIHLDDSPSNWIDYGNTKVVESWWQNNGLVAAMWHWNVPRNKDSDAFAFYTKDTNFDVTKATISGTYEYEIVMADFIKIANYLKLLKDKNIPVIWRPLHEGAGGWFWWGSKGAKAYKNLWIMMFEFFKDKELNNLIWVWTSQMGDNDWYPGDEYVDIIGRDAYDVIDAKLLIDDYKALAKLYPNKMIALSEFGSIANLKTMWNGGAKWLWAMPWYDYERTNNTQNLNFDNRIHMHADIDYWNKIFEIPEEELITLDQMPDLK